MYFSFMILKKTNTKQDLSIVIHSIETLIQQIFKPWISMHFTNFLSHLWLICSSWQIFLKEIDLSTSTAPKTINQSKSIALFMINLCSTVWFSSSLRCFSTYEKNWWPRCLGIQIRCNPWISLKFYK